MACSPSHQGPPTLVSPVVTVASRLHTAAVAVEVQADDFASIQAAIDSVAATGGTVYLEPHEYPLAKAIVLPSKVSLVGQSALDASGSMVLPVLRLADGANSNVILNKRVWPSNVRDADIRLANFRIDGNRHNQTGIRHGIEFYYVDRPVIEGVTVENCSSTGMTFSYCVDGTVRDSVASNNGFTNQWAATGINLNQYCTGFLIENNVCNANNGYRADIGSTPYDGNGIRIGDYSERNTIRGNTCNGNGRRGIKVQGANNLVSGNTLRDNMGHSILFTGYQVSGNLVQNNHVSAYYDSGIRVESLNTRNNTIEGNTITGCLYGIELSTDSTANRLLNNTVTASRGNGIYLRGTSDNTVQGNTVTNSGLTFRSNAIQIIVEGGRPSVRNVIDGNVCTDTRAVKLQAYGIKIEPGVDYTTVTNNDLRGNLWTGIFLSGTHNTVFNNLF